MNSLKRVIIFSLAYFPVEGGAEIALKEITSRIGEIDFDLITLRFDKSHLAQEKIGNVNVFRINSSKNLFPLKAFLLGARLHKERRYDAVWAIMANWAGLSALMFKYRFSKVPYVLTLQEGDSIEFIERRVRFISPIFRRIFRKADTVTAISNFLALWGRRMGAREVIVIPNGVDFIKFQNPNPKSQTSSKFENPMPIGRQENSKITLITTSRLVEKNAVGDIIEALKYLPENVYLKILGTGSLESALKLKTVNHNLQTRVQFLGHVAYDEIPEYLHDADIFVRPSLSEGFGNSFIEAMASGLPVIATPVGGITDFLTHEETGLFCEPNNPESIAKQVERLISDESLRERITDTALKMVGGKYDWNQIAEKMKSQVFLEEE